MYIYMYVVIDDPWIGIYCTHRRVRISVLLVSLWQYLLRGGIRSTLSYGLWLYCRFYPLPTKISSKVFGHNINWGHLFYGLTRKANMKAAWTGFEEAVVLQAFVCASEKTYRADNEVVVISAVPYTAGFVFSR